MGAADVDLVEMGDAAVAGGDGDVLELDVHVVLSYEMLASPYPKKHVQRTEGGESVPSRSLPR